MAEGAGGLELPLTAALCAAEPPVAVVNPGQPRDFARSIGGLAKTDLPDARVLAACGMKSASTAVAGQGMRGVFTHSPGNGQNQVTRH